MKIDYIARSAKSGRYFSEHCEENDRTGALDTTYKDDITTDFKEAAFFSAATFNAAIRQRDFEGHTDEDIELIPIIITLGKPIRTKKMDRE